MATNVQKINQLFIYKRDKKFNTTSVDKFKRIKRFALKTQIPGLQDFSVEFHFKTPLPSREPNILIFVTSTQILEFNFEEEELKVVYHLPSPMQR